MVFRADIAAGTQSSFFTRACDNAFTNNVKFLVDISTKLGTNCWAMASQLSVLTSAAALLRSFTHRLAWCRAGYSRHHSAIITITTTLHGRGMDFVCRGCTTSTQIRLDEDLARGLLSRQCIQETCCRAIPAEFLAPNCRAQASQPEHASPKTGGPLRQCLGAIPVLRHRWHTGASRPLLKHARQFCQLSSTEF